MKTLSQFLFTALLSLCLLHVPMADVYAQANSQPTNAQERRERAQEQNQKLVQQGGVVGSIMQSANEASSGITYDEDGKAQVTKKLDLDPVNDDVFVGDALIFVALIVIGLFAASLWRYKPMATDMQIALAGGVILIGSTAYALMQSRDEIDESTFELVMREDGSVNNMQVDALKQLRESYVSLAELSGTKWKIEAAGAAAFAAAAAMAIVRQAQWDSLRQACLSSSVSCPAAAGPGAAREAAVQTPTGTSTVDMSNIKMATEAFNRSMDACLAAAQAAIPFSSGLVAQITQAIAVCRADQVIMQELISAGEVDFNAISGGAASLSFPEFLDRGVQTREFFAVMDARKAIELQWGDYLRGTLEHIQRDHLDILATQYDLQRSWRGAKSSMSLDQYAAIKNEFEYREQEFLAKQQRQNTQSLLGQLSDLIMPRAHAVNLKMLGLGAAGVGIVMMLSGKTFKMFDTMMAVPMRRALVYGAAAGAAGGAAYVSKMVEDKSNDNVKKIDEILAQMAKLQNMPVVGGDPGGVQVLPPGSLLPPKTIRPAVIAPDGQTFPCAHAAPKPGSKCASLEREISSASGITSLGTNVSDLAALSGKVADGFMGNDSLSAGALGDINNLASQRALADRAHRQAQDAYNNRLKKEGKEPFDFEKGANRFRDQLSRAILRNLNERGTTPYAALASLGGPPSSILAGLAKDEDKKDGKDEYDPSLNEPKKAVGSLDPKGDQWNFDFGKGNSGLDYNDGASAGVYSEDGLLLDVPNPYESTDDIVGDRNVSLFKIISVRYLKSGFPRLFELND